MRTIRKSSELFPSLGLRLRSRELALGVGVGWLRDITDIETRTLSGNNLITDMNGNSYSGSDSANFLFFALSPTFRKDLSSQSAVSLGLEYQVFVDLSNGSGAFAGEPTSRALHNLGLKLSYLRAF